MPLDPRILGVPSNDFVSEPAPQQGGGSKITDILAQLAPVIAATMAGRSAGPQGVTAVLGSEAKHLQQQREDAIRQEQIDYTHGEVERRRREAAAQQRQAHTEKAAEFKLRAVQELSKIEDPKQWTATAQQLDQAYQEMFGGQEGDIKNNATYSDANRLKKDQAEALTLKDKLEKQYGQAQIWDANPTVTFKGETMKFRDLVALAGLQAGDLAPQASDPETKTAGSFDAQFNDDLKVEEEKKGRKLTAAERSALRLSSKKKYDAANDQAKTPPRERFSVQTYTKPDGTTGFLRVNLDTGDASSVTIPDGGGAGRPTDTQALTSGYYNRSTASDATARTFEAQLEGLGAQLDVKLPNLLRSEAGQRYRQAKDEFINAALRRESGAAIQPSEYERFDKIYFVQPGDTAATIRQKQQARARVVAGFKTAAGNLAGAGDPKASAVKKLNER